MRFGTTEKQAFDAIARLHAAGFRAIARLHAAGFRASLTGSGYHYLWVGNCPQLFQNGTGRISVPNVPAFLEKMEKCSR